MFDECKRTYDWNVCLTCKYLSLPVCPLEGDDAIDKIAYKIRMMEYPKTSGSKTNPSADPRREDHQEVSILIKVMYHDNTFDMVTQYQLAQLIIEHKIKMFLRSKGWVTIGIDPVRGKGGAYFGLERRRSS